MVIDHVRRRRCTYRDEGGEVDVTQLISVLGAARPANNATNIAGSAPRPCVAIADMQPASVVLEEVWALVGICALWHPTRQRA